MAGISGRYNTFGGGLKEQSATEKYVFTGFKRVYILLIMCVKNVLFFLNCVCLTILVGLRRNACRPSYDLARTIHCNVFAGM